LIYKNIDLICEICQKENRKIELFEIAYPKSTNNLEDIILKMQPIFDYQFNKQIIFITINDIFLRNYIKFNDKKNLKNLILIRKGISLCLNIDKLKNETLLDFTENDDVYFKDKKYESKNFRTLEVFNGIDLETFDDKNYEKWNMKDFIKLLKLLNNNDKYTDIFLKDKFNKLIFTDKFDNCPNFIKDVSYFIYIIDKNYQGIKDFMKDIIEKNIESFETLENIYLYLYSNYKTISKDVIDNIINFLVKNMDNIKGESILILLEKVNSPSLIKSILNRIDNFIIKEEELFSQEEEIDSFKLLKGIEEENLMQKIPSLSNTKYLMETLNLGNKILNKIKVGDIKYNLFNSIWLGKKKIFEERLDILFFNYWKDVKSNMKIFEDYFKKFSIAKAFFKKLGDVLKEFYEVTHKKNIKKLEDLEKEINDGNLNIIDKEEIKERIYELKNVLPDLHNVSKRNTIN